MDSKKEVHLFLRAPEGVNSFGLTFPIGSLHKEKTQNADYFYRTKFSLIDYYKNKALAR